MLSQRCSSTTGAIAARFSVFRSLYICSRRELVKCGPLLFICAWKNNKHDDVDHHRSSEDHLQHTEYPGVCSLFADDLLPTPPAPCYTRHADVVLGSWKIHRTWVICCESPPTQQARRTSTGGMCLAVCGGVHPVFTLPYAC